MKLARTALGPLTVLAAGEGPPLFYLGGLLPVAGVDSSLAHRAAARRGPPRAGPSTRSAQHRLPPVVKGPGDAGPGRSTRPCGRRQAGARLDGGWTAAGRRGLERLVAPLMGRFTRQLGDLSDLATTIEAEDQFDLARCDGTITAPTLIVAGERDRFYPGLLIEETRRLIPGSVLTVIPRRGHVTVMSDSRVVAMVRGHLTATTGRAR